MNSRWHEAITRKALKESGLKEHAKDLIVMANRDSDHAHSGLGYERQHYQGTDCQERIIEMSFWFWMDVLNDAATIAHWGDVYDCKGRNFTVALYWIGRAFHCIQDFYAHSNWIAIGKDQKFDGKDVPTQGDGARLFFCHATPDGQQLDNWDRLAWLYKPVKTPAINLKLLKLPLFGATRFNIFARRKKDSYQRMRTQQLQHPEAHLDFAGCWADKVIKTCQNDATSGFSRAFKLAHEQTEQEWGYFLGLLPWHRRFGGTAYSRNLKKLLGWKFGNDEYLKPLFDERFRRLHGVRHDNTEARLRKHLPDESATKKTGINAMRSLFNHTYRIRKGKLAFLKDVYQA